MSNPKWLFPGLRPGDKWCLCASRWAQALSYGCAPKVYLLATHERTLEVASLDVLLQYAADRREATEVLERLNNQRAQLERSLILA